MANPITWRNVETPDLRGVGVLMNGAREGINSGFEGVNSVFNKLNTQNEANWQNQKTMNTQSYLDELSTAKTPEELIQKQTFLDSMRSGFGAQVDLPAIRSAHDSREAILQNRWEAQTKFKEAKEREADKDTIESFQARALTGESLPTLLKEINGAPLNNRAAAIKALTEAGTTYTNNQLTSLKTQSEKNTLTNQLEDAALTNQAGTFLQEHRGNMLDLGAKLGTIASRFELPVNSDGTARMESYTPEQKERIYNVAKGDRWKLSNPQQFEGGDTSAADNFLQKMRDAVNPDGSRKFTDAAITRNMSTLRSAADSTSGTGSVGNAAYNRSVAEAATQASMETIAKDSWHPIGTNEAKQSADAAYKVVLDEVPEADRKAVNAVLDKLYTQGITIKDSSGKTKTVVPSIEYVKSKLRSTSDTWKDWTGWKNTKDGPEVPWYQLGNASLAQKVEHNLFNGYDKDKVIEWASNGEKYNAWKLKQQAKEIYKTNPR